MRATDTPRRTAAPATDTSSSQPGDVPESLNRRVVVERIRPSVGGCPSPYAVKRTPGEPLDVTADVFADGHDKVCAVLLWRKVPPRAKRDSAGSTESPAWTEAPMRPLENDAWTGSFTVPELGEYEYTVEGWIDRFATWRGHLEAKWGAAQDVETELVEGAAMLDATLAHTRDEGRELDEAWLRGVAKILGDGREDVERRVTVALDSRLAAAMEANPDRTRATRFDPPLRLVADRERARFGAWYEMFPRSLTPDPTRSATFAEAEAALPRIADMGFDVVYLPPIHPIGRKFRKGRNNALQAAPGDPGSPWAIGAEEGGHTAIEPGLGTFDDFASFVDTANRLDLEIALDLAFQTSPDHPYVKDHPEWFRQRPDGTIKYAENPPKKYQDIYPLDFEGPAWRAVWSEMEAITRFWIDHGVRIFRVDNPHTKPFRFWQWMIERISADHPDVIFLAEAFTRPKIMYLLAKLGFNQSYTYFTWRNTKAELTEYFTELRSVGDFMRGNLFVNTPDILTEYLQDGGRPAFRARLVLAATLGASYGIYSGFELCENVPVRRGSEEYLDSEKYQLRPRQWDQPGNIRELIARLNDIRRGNRALQSDQSLRFHETDNPQIIAYSKSTPDHANIVFTIVNLDPAHMQHGWVRVPLADFGVAAGEPYDMHDLLDDSVYTWRDEWNYVRLEPEVMPAHVLRIEPAAAPPSAAIPPA